ncbi:uncharacterized protein LOC126803076 isoform X1 [Argentina anserina]|uniref:uncharacterized protein LOC126803076 isoform X1 n=1 Tax=Argentina anserina TaxID=57926 RepID=UPI0021762679|nr:uncharacterized protein LOC126803076 isoform X1 [Potentilla anserina]XP_050386784.1 uncharacterized protein LOC126803076 isoform X1 [Potentilla anserina]
MKEPTFIVGMEFPSSKAFKAVVRKHYVQTGKELRFPTNCRHKVEAKCLYEGCPWRIYSSTTDKKNLSIWIRTIYLEHMCTTLGKKVYHMHAPFIVEEYANFFMTDPKWSRERIQNAVNRDFEMEVDYQMCYRAKKQVENRAQGTYEEQVEKRAQCVENRVIILGLVYEGIRYEMKMMCFTCLFYGWKEDYICDFVGCRVKMCSSHLMRMNKMVCNNKMLMMLQLVPSYHLSQASPLKFIYICMNYVLF